MSLEQSLAELQQRFAIGTIAQFRQDAGGLIRCNISTARCQAEIFLQGAHITCFQPVGQLPLLFTSAQSQFAPGKPIRGGIPVCFPWFGPRAGDSAAPLHGLARILPWNVESLGVGPDGAVKMVFALADSDRSRPIWARSFALRLIAVFGQHLDLTLQVNNTGMKSLTFEEAFHTYFAVADVRGVSITGLSTATYVDKADGMKRKVQDAEPIRIAGETDRVYLSAPGRVIIDDPGARRRIVMDKAGSDTTVVWNPWIAKAKAMPDFGDDEWPSMLCVETANASENAVVLASGQSHTMNVVLRVETY